VGQRYLALRLSIFNLRWSIRGWGSSREVHVVNEVSHLRPEGNGESKSRKRTDGCDGIGEVVRVVLIGEAAVVPSAFGIKVR